MQAQVDCNSVCLPLRVPMSGGDGRWDCLRSDRRGGQTGYARDRGGMHNQNRGGGSAASSSGLQWTPKSLPLTTLCRDIREDELDDELPDMGAESSHAGCEQMSILMN